MKEIKKTIKSQDKEQIEKRLRLAVFRSNKFIYGQIIDDEKGYTLASIAEKELPEEKQKEKNLQKAALLGEMLAVKAQEVGVKKVKFDRRCYRYHGRVKAFAEGARKGGLQF